MTSKDELLEAAVGEITSLDLLDAMKDFPAEFAEYQKLSGKLRRNFRARLVRMVRQGADAVACERLKREGASCKTCEHYSVDFSIGGNCGLEAHGGCYMKVKSSHVCSSFSRAIAACKAQNNPAATEDK